jgi:serine/threonine protein kinase
MVSYAADATGLTRFSLDELVFSSEKTRIFAGRLFDRDENSMRDVMVKSMKLRDNTDDINREISNWKNLKHENIIQLICSCEYQGSMLLFMERGESLTQYATKLVLTAIVTKEVT